MRVLLLMTTAFMLPVLSQCENPPHAVGVLKVNAPTHQQGLYRAFDIYQIIDDGTRFVSKPAGMYEQDIILPVGEYLLLADCSSAKVSIKKDRTTVLMAHQLIFHPPVSPHAKDIFHVQCMRHASMTRQQNFHNEYSLHLIGHTAVTLSVGLNSKTYDFFNKAHTKPQVFKQQLSAVTVESFSSEQNQRATHEYFVSRPEDGKQAHTTQAQVLGRTQFMLPGEYTVTLNSTTRHLSLRPGEAKVLKTSQLTFMADQHECLSDFQEQRGEPYLVSLNASKSFFLNRSYELLPGRLTYKLPDHTDAYHHSLQEGVHHQITLKSLIVRQHCAPMEWECLGKKHVNVYTARQSKPIIKSTTDVPILYQQKHIYLEMESSKGLKVPVLTQGPHQELGLGTVTVVARNRLNHLMRTDLIRLEGTQDKIKGFSYDIESDNDTSFDLIEGTYRLSQYQTPLAAKETLTPGDAQLSQHTKIHIKKFLKKTIFVYHNTKKASKRARSKQSTQPMNKMYQQLLFSDVKYTGK